jgi:protein tyrosine phosphatase
MARQMSDELKATLNKAIQLLRKCFHKSSKISIVVEPPGSDLIVICVGGIGQTGTVFAREMLSKALNEIDKMTSSVKLHGATPSKRNVQ